MNFNKCSRCGCFFINGADVCPNCSSKDQLEINRLKNYIEENINATSSIDEVSYSTGISAKNLNRFFKQDEFSAFANQFQNNIKTEV